MRRLKDKKYHYTYRLDDTKNGKYYYGMHETDDLNDGYMGSGRRLNKTIKARCIKTILLMFDTREEMIKAEQELITEEVVMDENSYNMAFGGEGGDTMTGHPRLEEIKKQIKETFEAKPEEEKRRIYDTRRKYGETNGMYGVIRRGKDAPAYGRKATDEQRERLSKSLKAGFANGRVTFTKGKPCLETVKRAVAEANAEEFKFVKDGQVVEVKNLNQFCRDNDLNPSCMGHVNKGRNKSHKGYTKYNG